MKTVDGVFQSDGQQLVSPKTIEAWQLRLDPTQPEARELAMRISEEFLGHDLSLYQNFPLPPPFVARIEALTGVKARISVDKEGAEEEALFETVYVPFNGDVVEPTQAELPDMPFIVEDANLIGFARAVGDAARRMPLSVEQRARAISLLNEELGKVLTDPNYS